MRTRRGRLADWVVDEIGARGFGSAAEVVDASYVWAAIHSLAQQDPDYFFPDVDWEQPSRSDKDAENEAYLGRLLTDLGISHWWDSPLDRTGQRLTRFDNELDLPIPPGDPARDLATWVRMESSTDSSVWWSAPLSKNVVTTTRDLGSLAPAGYLLSCEDEAGRQRARIWPASPIALEIPVFEVASADDWVRLVELAPLDVTAGRKSTWGRLDASCRWFVPDWSVVSERYAAVHVTVNAWLDFSSVPIECEQGRTLLSAWGADETIWLRTPPLTWHEPLEVFRSGETQWDLLPLSG